MSKGTKGSPVSAARRRRKSSNISFQAAAWTVAVRVRTPSRSNRPARIPSGRPSTAGTYPKRGLVKRSAVVPRRQAGGDEALLVAPAARVEGIGDPERLGERRSTGRIGV